MTPAEQLLTEQGCRLGELDALLPAPAIPPPGDVLTARSADGPVAGVLVHIEHPTRSPARMWSATSVSELVPMLGAAAGDGMRALLAAWRALLPGLDLPAVDSACVVSWPSRDVHVGRALLDHGFVPLSVLAVRVPAAAPRAVPAPVRRATLDDLDDCVQLALAEQSYSALVGGTVIRPEAPELKHTLLDARLRRGEPIWVAERDDVVIGLAECGYSDAVAGSWTATRLLPGKWGYVNCVSVLAGERGRGIGRALLARAHEAFAAAGTMGSYLYYNPPNPLSSVFWPRLGYRPLWTVWEARPASALR